MRILPFLFLFIFIFGCTLNDVDLQSDREVNFSEKHRQFDFIGNSVHRSSAIGNFNGINNRAFNNVNNINNFKKFRGR